MNPRLFANFTIAHAPLQPCKKPKRNLPSPEEVAKQFSKELDTLLAALNAAIVLNKQEGEIDDLVELDVKIIVRSHISELSKSVTSEKGSFAIKAKLFEDLRSRGCYDEKETHEISEKLKKAVKDAHILSSHFSSDSEQVNNLIKPILKAIYLNLKKLYLNVSQISNYVPPTITEVLSEQKVNSSQTRKI